MKKKSELIEENEQLKQLLRAQRDVMGEQSIKLNEMEMGANAFLHIIDMSESVEPRIAVEMLKFFRYKARV